MLHDSSRFFKKQVPAQSCATNPESMKNLLFVIGTKAVPGAIRKEPFWNCRIGHIEKSHFNGGLQEGSKKTRIQRIVGQLRTNIAISTRSERW